MPPTSLESAPHPKLKSVDPKIEADAQRTSAMLESVISGDNSMSQVFAEIDRDRKRYGFGSQQDNEYMNSVHASLKKVLPQISLSYAKENFDYLSTNKDRITADTMLEFRFASYKDMNKVERAMVHYLRDNFDYLKKDPESNCKTRLSERDIDEALKRAKDGSLRDKRSVFIENEAENGQAKYFLNALTKDNNLLFKKLQDGAAQAITKESLQHAIDFDNGHYNEFLNGPEKQATFRMLQNFDLLSRGDDEISNTDLKYYGSKSGVDTPTIPYKPGMKLTEQRIRTFDR